MDFPMMFRWCSRSFPNDKARSFPRCLLRRIPAVPHLHLETDWGIGAVELLNGSGKPSASDGFFCMTGLLYHVFIEIDVWYDSFWCDWYMIDMIDI